MRNLTFKAAMWKSSRPTVNRQSTDGQSQRHCKQTPLTKRWKVLMTLVFLFTLAIGQMWGDINFKVTSTVSIANKNVKVIDGAYVTRNGSTTSVTSSGWTTGGGNCFAVFEVAGASTIKAYLCNTSTSAVSGKTISCGSVSSTVWTALGTAATNETEYKMTTGDVSSSSDKSVSFNKNAANTETAYEFTASSAGKYAVYWASSIGSSVYLTKIEIVASSGGCTAPTITTDLSTTKVEYEQNAAATPLAIEATGTNVTYQWYSNTENSATTPTPTALENCTTKTYTPSTSTSGTTYYFCVASSSTCSTTSKITPVEVSGGGEDPEPRNLFTINMTATSETNITHGTKVELTSIYGTVTGGYTVLYNKHSSDDSKLKVNSNGISISGNDPGVILYLNEPLHVGDKIEFTSSVSKEIKIGVADDKDVTLATTSSKSYTVASEGLAGKQVIYLWRVNNTTNIKTLTISTTAELPTFRTVTFDPNYTSATNITRTVADGAKVVYVPKDPENGTQEFEGWFEGSAENAFDFANTPITANKTLTARWTASTVKYSVTYAAGEGSGTMTDANEYKENDEVTVLENAFTTPAANKKFSGWSSSPSVTISNGKFSMPASNVTLTAQWTEFFTITYKDGESTLKTEDVFKNAAPVGYTPTKALNTFAGWKDGDGNTVDPTTLTAAAILFAQWTKTYANSVDFETYIAEHDGDKNDEDKAKNYVESQNYALSTKTGTTFDATTDNNGAYKGLKIKHSGTTLSWNVAAGKLVIFKTGFMDTNGSLSINGGAATAIDGGSKSSGDNFKNKYFYSATEATYVFTTGNKNAAVVKAITIQNPFTVTFNANGGDPVAQRDGTPSVTLPSASKGADNFLGWFTEETGGTKIGDAGASYTPTADIELFAHWEAISTDARLASITFSSNAGTLSPAFDPEVTSYTYTMPYGTAAIPTITGATSVSNKAQDPIIGDAAAAWGDAQTVKGVAQSGDKKTYTITMVKAPKDGVVIIHADIPSGTSADYAATGLYAGTGNSKNEGNSLKLGTNHYAGVNLSGSEIFKEGDILNIHVKTKNGFVKAPISTTNAVDGSGVIFTEERSFVVGDNFITLTSAFEEANSSSLYLVRTTAIDAECNPAVDYIEVTRAMNPVLTAISFNGVAATKGTGNAFSVTLPETGTNLASLTIVPTIIRNAAHATTPEAVISNSGAWKAGDNTYRVMDKDGDYTDYTITITLQGSAETPVINAQPAGSAYCAGSEPTLTVGVNEVSDGGTLHYAWYKKGDTDTQVGSDAASYTIASAGTYYVIITNHVDGKLDKSVTSENAVVTLNVAAEITTQPVGLSAEAGDAVSLSVVATNATSYQWYKDGVLIAGAEAATYEFTAPAATASYYCVVGNACGDDLTSNIAQVAIEAGDCNWIGAGQTIAFPEAKNTETAIGTTSLKMKTSKDINTSNVKYGDVDVANTLKMDGNYIDIYTADHNIGVIQASNTSNGDNVYNYCVIFCSSNTWNEEKILSVVELAGNNKHNTEIAVVAAPMGTKFARIQRYYEWNETAYGTNTSSYLVKVRVCEIEAAPEADVTVTSEPASQNVCALGEITALSYVLAIEEGASVSYQWYNADGDVAIEGANDASYTPAAVGTYYCKAVATKTGKMPKDLQSASATIVLNTATAITTAPANQRGAKDAQVTLSVVATGTNLSYEWFTCTNQAGEGAVALDPAQTGTSINVTITENMHQWYKVAVHGACGDEFATALVEEWSEVAQADVTESQEWDWNKTSNAAAWSGVANIQLTGDDKTTDFVMANTSSTMPNNNNFHSDMLVVNGEYPARPTQDGGVFQGYAVKFHTTVPGKVTVVYRGTGNSANVNLVINDHEFGNEQDWHTKSLVVPAGNVVITEKAGGVLRIRSIEFKAAAKLDPDATEDATLGGYERDVTEGRYGTICLPNGGVMVGATIYTLAYYGATSQKIFFDEVLNGTMEAGKPYLFLPNEGIDRIGVFYTDAEGETAKSINGFVGYIGASEDDYTQVPAGEGNYIVQNNQYREIQAGATAYILSHRAYIKFSEIGTTEPAKAPGVRRIGIGGEAPAVTTGVEGLHIGDQPVKVMIDGQIFILRGEKMYDATGRLVK